MRKFKRFKHHTVQASQFLQKLAKERVDLFVHWRNACGRHVCLMGAE